MKQPGEELQETLTELDDRAVVDYLIKNPEFFIRNARAVEAIRVPGIRYAAPFRWSSGTWPAHVIIFMFWKRTWRC
ncbi:DUF484 family protein [Escherichia coli]